MYNYYGIIYIVSNRVNGKVYIGQTVQDLAERKRKHFNVSVRDNCYFHNALIKYGDTSFVWEVLEYCNSKKELDEMEFHYIKQYNSFKPNGYNMTLGGEGSFGYKHSKEIRKKMSKVSLLSNNHVNRGKRLPKEWRDNIAKANTGKKWTKEQYKNYINSRSGKYIGSTNKNSKKFVITTPKGENFYIIGLANFCKNFKGCTLDFRLMSAVAHGKRTHHKQYKCRHYNVNIDNKIPYYEVTTNG